MTKLLVLISLLASTVISAPQDSSSSAPPPAQPGAVNIVTSLIQKRDDTVAGQVSYFRTDLKPGKDQDPKFKNLLLSHKASPKYPSRIDVTFVNQNERDVADTGLVESRGISLVSSNGTTSSPTAYLNVEVDTKNDLNRAQRVTYDDKQKDGGFFYVVYNELKLASTNPPWDTWLACDGQEGYPLLWWAAAVPKANNTAVVSIPLGCSAVRIFLDPVGEGQSNSQVDYCKTVLENANMGSNDSQPQNPATRLRSRFAF